VPPAPSQTPPARLDRAFSAAPRARFLPRWQVAHAPVDQPLDIGHGQTSSQPSTVRAMLALLDVHAGQRVLDVGSGSGWTTALLAQLVGPGGQVVGVEIQPELAAWGAANLARCHLPWARIELALPDVLGWPDDAPYDRVLVSAQARHVPAPLVEQLAEGGVMVCPVHGELVRVVRERGGGVSTTSHGSYRFVPLRGATGPTASGTG
jgi:protein-L-isoaspartate(D-aspartate) O-methyltransferase